MKRFPGFLKPRDFLSEAAVFSVCEEVLTLIYKLDIILKHFFECARGGIAQLARASGSYPAGRRFKSHCRYHFGPLVNRLRRRPFTAERRVQLSYGSPWYHSQAVRPGSAKPLCPGSNPGGTSKITRAVSRLRQPLLFLAQRSFVCGGMLWTTESRKYLRDTMNWKL